jgi:hypothetical protein
MLQRFQFSRCFVIILFSLLLVVTPNAFSQAAGVGTITGTVMDANKAPLANAHITLRSTDTGSERQITANDEGIYTATLLQPGVYEMTVTATGFATVTRKAIVLTVGQSLTVDYNLPLASVQSTVEVSAENPLLDTQQTSVSQTIGSQLITSLPVASRNWSSFALSTTNVTNDGSSGLVSYRGISGLYNSNLVDGANNNQALFSEARGRASGAPYVYSLDSIKEFQVDTATYSAEFGQAAGGQINAVTRSGTNSTHGDLFYYLRYPSLNALDSYNKSQGLKPGGNPVLLTPTVHQQQQFGGSVGGPIIKNKLFYFFTYDGFHRVAPVLYTSTANISLTPSGPTTSTSTITPTQCPLTITSTQGTDAITYLLSLSGSYSRLQVQNIIFPRLDWQINDKNHVSVSFNAGNYKSPSGYAGGPSYSNTSVTTNGTAYYHERFLVGNWQSQISNLSVNQFLFQWGRDLETAGTNAPGPSVSLSNLQTYGMPNALPRTAEPDENRYQFTDVWSTTRGRHTLKVGGDFNLIHEVMINLFQGGGIYNYSGTTALANFQNWAVDVYGSGGSSAPLAGRHYTSFTQVYDPITKVGKDDFWMKVFDGFAEDTWKVLPNLTLNLGVRYDLQLTPQPPQPNKSSELAAYYTQQLKTVKDRVLPRLGLAWTPQPGTVVRAGYGIFGALTQGSTYYAMRVENGVYQTSYSFNSPTLPGAPSFPNLLFTPPGPPLAAPFEGAATPQVTPGGSAIVTSFHGLDPNFVPPIANEYELGVEQELPGKLTLNVGYVGTRALRLPIFIDANIAPATTTRNYGIYNSAGTQTSLINEPFYTTRKDPTNGSINTGFSVVNSWYNAMAVTLKRPFEHGFQMLFNYTWSKAIDSGQVAGAFGTFYGSDFPVDPYNINAEHGRSDLDQRGRFVGSLVWEPMFFQNVSNHTAKYIANGWTFSGIFTDATGFPITGQMTGYPQTNYKLSGALEGGLTGGVMSSSSGLATAGRAPQLQRNSYVGPGLQNADVRLTRDFPIHENIHFQIFAEAFNVMNHTNVLSVATTAFSYVAPGAKLPGSGVACPTAAAGGDGFTGCVAPFVSSSSPFGSTTSTSGILFGARQLQFTAKLFF